MPKPFLVFENIEQASRRELFNVLGTTWAATPGAWLSPLFWCVLGVTLAVLGCPGGTTPQAWVSGLVYGLLLYAVNAIHSVGHVLAARLVGSPMAVNLLTATRDVAFYREPGSTAPRGIRLGRALGGPMLNLVCGLCALALAPIAPGPWLAMFGYFNVCIAVWTLLPIPTLDGAVIWGLLVPRDRG